MRAQEAVAAHRCGGRPATGCAATTPVRLTLVRAGVAHTVELTPRDDAHARRLVIGLLFDAAPVPVGVGAAAAQRVTTMWTVTTTNAKARDEVSGIVGSYEVVRQSSEFDAVPAIGILAIVLMTLAIVNSSRSSARRRPCLLGARREAPRRSPASLRVMDVSSVVGLLLVAFPSFVACTRTSGG